MWDRKFKIIFTVFVTALIIGSVFLISLNAMNSFSVSPQTVSKSTSGSSGLELMMKTSGSNITQGKNISISLEVLNPGFLAINVSSNGIIWNAYHEEGFSTGPCSFKPFGILIAYGNYSASQLKFASPLQFYAPGAYFCSVIPAVDQYVFSPHSSNARMYYNSVESIPGQDTASFNYQLNISGYWTGNSESNAAFHTYSPGVYTIFGADGWNQITVLHFLVK